MKQVSTTFLRAVIILIGLIVLALCILALPAGLRTAEAGYYRPILAGLYLPAIPFFIALHRAFVLLNNIDKNKAFSASSLTALRHIQYCAVTISALFAAGMPYIYTVADRDDAPGVLALGLVIVFAATVIATFSVVLQRLILSGLELKSENDLTV